MSQHRDAYEHFSTNNKKMETEIEKNREKGGSSITDDSSRTAIAPP